MADSLFVDEEILIDAPPETIWRVLTESKYVAQWDELPEGYPEGAMSMGSKVVWELPDGGQSITTIINAEPQKELKISLFVSKWEEKIKEGDIAYLFQLEERGRSTLLKIRIGDFSLIKNGRNYYEASVEFAGNSKKVIKELAES